MKQKTSRPHFREFNPIRELVTKDTGLEKPYILSYNLSFDNKEVFGAVALCEDKLYIREGNS
ncbi:MAG: hypothetical protein IJB49_07755, partial [Clostridia bacterium]|nr:hypothetical protein [Clostridia bacterium]